MPELATKDNSVCFGEEMHAKQGRDLPVFGEAETKAPTSGLYATDTLNSTGVAPELVMVMLWVLEAVLVKEALAKSTKGAKLSGVMFTLGAVLKYVCRRRLGVPWVSPFITPATAVSLIMLRHCSQTHH